MTDLQLDDVAETPAKQARALTDRPLVLLAAIIGGSAFFLLSSPQSAPSLLLIMGFVVLALVLAATTNLLLIVSSLHARLRPARRRAIILVAVALPVMLLMLQSIGQLTVRDVITLGGLCLIGLFYIDRVRLRKD